jgi:hypothetical protein
LRLEGEKRKSVDRKRKVKKKKKKKKKGGPLHKMSAASSAQESSVTVTTGDSTEALLLRTVASLVGAASVSVVTTTEGEGEDGTKAAAAKTTSLVATSANRFAGREVEERAVGWTGCARWLARRGDGCPPLAGATAAERAAVDSWMDAAESQVQAAARQGASCACVFFCVRFRSA